MMPWGKKQLDHAQHRIWTGANRGREPIPNTAWNRGSGKAVIESHMPGAGLGRAWVLPCVCRMPQQKAQSACTEQISVAANGVTSCASAGWAGLRGGVNGQIPPSNINGDGPMVVAGTKPDHPDAIDAATVLSRSGQIDHPDEAARLTNLQAPMGGRIARFFNQDALRCLDDDITHRLIQHRELGRLTPVFPDTNPGLYRPDRARASAHGVRLGSVAALRSQSRRTRVRQSCPARHILLRGRLLRS